MLYLYFLFYFSLQGSNFPRLFWGAFTPNTVCHIFSCYVVYLFIQVSLLVGRVGIAEFWVVDTTKTIYFKKRT
jgi:hypothetical protein